MKNTFNKFLLSSVISSAFVNAQLFGEPGRHIKIRPVRGKDPQQKRIKSKTVLSKREKIIKGMTNWQNHQWMKVGVRKAPDKFAKMIRWVAV